jgi:alkylresorcinol/alkylpyrone synthase
MKGNSGPAPRIVSIGAAVPPFSVSQEELREAARVHFSRELSEVDRLLNVFDNVEVENRHFCVPLHWLRSSHSFAERNREYQSWAFRLSREAILRCLEKADVDSRSIDHLVFVSSSGMATPSIDASLINSLNMPPTVHRTPVFGLGCAGGAAGLARSAEICRARERTVLLVAVEISSLTFQVNDFGKSNFVAASLFSDGAAAALITSRDFGHGPVLVDDRSWLWPDTLDAMGWNFTDGGLQVVFSKRIPFMIQQRLRETMDPLLQSNGLTMSGIRHFVLHPGGGKILKAYQKCLGIDRAQLRWSRDILARFGNMSAPTVLFVLERFLEAAEAQNGDWGLCAAFGPGFSSELSLLRW